MNEENNYSDNDNTCNTANTSSASPDDSEDYFMEQIKKAPSWEVLFVMAALWIQCKKIKSRQQEHQCVTASAETSTTTTENTRKSNSNNSSKENVLSKLLSPSDAAVILHSALLLCTDDHKTPSNVMVTLIQMFPQGASIFVKQNDDDERYPISPLMYAIHHRLKDNVVNDPTEFAVIGALVEAYPSAVCTDGYDDDDDQTPLHFICSKKGVVVQLIRMMLQVYPCAADMIDGDGQTPLHTYCCSHAPYYSKKEHLMKANIRIDILRELIKYNVEACDTKALNLRVIHYDDDDGDMNKRQRRSYYNNCTPFEFIILHLAKLCDQIVDGRQIVEIDDNVHDVVAFLFNRMVSDPSELNIYDNSHERFITNEKTVTTGANAINPRTGIMEPMPRCPILHIAIMCEVKKKVIEALLKVYPHHLTMVDFKGRLPLVGMIEQFPQAIECPSNFITYNMEVAQMMLQKDPSVAASTTIHKLQLFQFACVMISDVYIEYNKLSDEEKLEQVQTRSYDSDEERDEFFQNEEESEGDDDDDDNSSSSNSELDKTKQVKKITNKLNISIIGFLFTLLKCNPTVIEGQCYTTTINGSNTDEEGREKVPSHKKLKSM